MTLSGLLGRIWKMQNIYLSFLRDALLRLFAFCLCLVVVASLPGPLVFAFSDII